MDKFSDVPAKETRCLIWGEAGKMPQMSPAHHKPKKLACPLNPQTMTIDMGAVARSFGSLGRGKRPTAACDAAAAAPDVATVIAAAAARARSPAAHRHRRAEPRARSPPPPR